MLSLLRKRRAIIKDSEHLIAIVQVGIPVANQNRVFEPKLPKDASRTIRKLAVSASEIAATYGGRTLPRAYLANRIRWGLSDLGYTEAFVENIVASVVVAMQPVQQSDASRNTNRPASQGKRTPP